MRTTLTPQRAIPHLVACVSVVALLSCDEGDVHDEEAPVLFEEELDVYETWRIGGGVLLKVTTSAYGKLEIWNPGNVVENDPTHWHSICVQSGDWFRWLPQDGVEEQNLACALRAWIERSGFHHADLTEYYRWLQRREYPVYTMAEGKALMVYDLLDRIENRDRHHAADHVAQ